MAANPAGEAGSEPLKYQTWRLKVPMHCEGCKKTVKKVLQSIDGVYAVAIDSQQQKVTVTGDVDLGMLIRKLGKTGKRAEIWPQPFEMKDKKTGKSKKNKKQNNPETNGGDQQKNQEEALTETQEENRDDEFPEEEGHDGDETETPSAAGSAGNGAKKKKKKGKQGNAGGGGAGGWSPPAREGMGPPVRPVNPIPPSDQRVYQSHPPNYSYDPILPAYGVSYNVAPPFATSSYNDMHVHDGFVQPRFGYLPPQPPYRIRPFRYDDDEDDDGRGCSII
ncbi:hypothetical protein NMG60_11013855 [Bertholletia excelsa]